MLGIESNGDANNSNFFSLENIATLGLGVWKITEDGKIAKRTSDNQLAVATMESQNKALQSKNLQLAIAGGLLIIGLVVLKSAKVF